VTIGADWASVETAVVASYLEKARNTTLNQRLSALPKLGWSERAFCLTELVRVPSIVCKSLIQLQSVGRDDLSRHCLC
jgi:hypothetical protein